MSEKNKPEPFKDFLIKALAPRGIDGTTYNATAMQVLNGNLAVDGGGRPFTRKQHPLDEYYYRLGVINADQYRAGTNFLRDYAVAFWHKSIIERLMEVYGAALVGEENKMTARDRYTRVKVCLSPKSRWLADLVIIQGYMLVEIKDKMKWTARNTGADRFAEALDEIDEFYRRLKAGENILERVIEEEDKIVLASPVRTNYNVEHNQLSV